MKTSSRVMGATAVLMLAFSTVACTDSDATPVKTMASPSVTPTATVDPASESIPVDGDDDVPITWSTEGVDVADPAVVVARRNIALRLLASDSRSWIDGPKLLSALDAVSKDDKLARRRFEQTAKARPADREPLPGPYHVLLFPPTLKGDSVMVDACVAIDDAYPAPPGSGFDDDTAYEIQTLTVRAVDGAWKVTKRGHAFAGGSDIDPELDQRCAAHTSR